MANIHVGLHGLELSACRHVGNIARSLRKNTKWEKVKVKQGQEKQAGLLEAYHGSGFFYKDKKNPLAGPPHLIAAGSA
ncbi:hypothetical protein D9M68_669370 [compost metagenome]